MFIIKDKILKTTNSDIFVIPRLSSLSLHIMIRQLALLACLASACHGFVRLNFEDDAENKMSIARGPRSFLGDPQSDAYIDKILENLRQLILDQNMDPMDLPDISTGFSDTILGITWHGEANVSMI